MTRRRRWAKTTKLSLCLVFWVFEGFFPLWFCFHTLKGTGCTGKQTPGCYQSLISCCGSITGADPEEDLTTVAFYFTARQIIPTVRPFCPFVPSHFLLSISATDDTNAVLIVTSRLFFILISGGWDTMGPVAICDASPPSIPAVF